MFTRARLTRWTKALRDNSEQQYQSALANKEYTKFCCLGKLCEVEGLERLDVKEYHNGGYVFQDVNSTSGQTISRDFLVGDLMAEFGSGMGTFRQLGMPDIISDNRREDDCSSAADANDVGVSWKVIADHFDKYYPCSDEPVKDSPPTVTK